MTQPQTIATRPLCVGRFLIDVPVDAKVIGTQTTSSSAAGTISVQNAVTKGAFKAKMEDIETKLRSAPHQTEGSRLSELLRPDDTTYIFRYRKNDVGARVYQIDGYRWAESALFTVNSGASNDRFLAAIGDVKRGLSTMAPRDTWVIPTEPGFCFDNGFLPGRDSTFEATGVQLEFPEFPNLLISFSTRSNDKPTPDGAQLLTRTDAVLQGVVGSDRPSVLRRLGARAIGGRSGQEVMWKWLKNGSVMLSGNAEVYASSRQLDAPDIAFALALDPPKQVGGATSKENGTLQLWDSIIQSIRLRPGAL